MQTRLSPIFDPASSQAAAIKRKGLELAVTLGTGVGTGLFRNGGLMPHLELAHHPVHGGKYYNEYLGKKALEKIGKKKWNGRVQRVLEILHDLLQPDMVYIGGGDSRNITFKLDTHIQLISNEDGILGGFMAWEMSPGTPKKLVAGDGDAMP